MKATTNDPRKVLEAKGLCAASTPRFGAVVYCTNEIAHGADVDHTDGTHTWPDIEREYSRQYLAKLAREPQTRVRDFAGDPRRDPRLVEDLSIFFVAPPTSRRGA